ncbi:MULTISPECIES: glycosyltransferase family 2 protein [unclassified Aeromonas]|uniref:glycosyltransferase family 2 protein n=1 Tax=unclassified Aeromonas TaxID=257493 RepID=UPI0022E1CC2C|nr:MULTISPECIES: glycosyltransferase family A protein [unclassified Aeromonas]
MGFSVVIPVFNKQREVERTIKSVLAQECDFDIEVVAVDDGSTDDSFNVIQAIEDPRVRLIRKENGGESDARNIGILNCKYENVAFLDADDVWEIDFLSTIGMLISKYPNAEVFCTKYARVNGCSRNEPNHGLWLKSDGYIDDYFKQVNSMLGDMILTSSSVCIKKSAISKVGLFPYGDRLGADQDYWFRIFSRGLKVAYSNKICAIYFLDASERICNNLDRYNNLNFIKRNYSRVNSKEANRYLANARIGAINDLFDQGKKIEATLTLLKECLFLKYATPKRLFASVAKVLK